MRAHAPHTTPGRDPGGPPAELASPGRRGRRRAGGGRRRAGAPVRAAGLEAHGAVRGRDQLGAGRGAGRPPSSGATTPGNGYDGQWFLGLAYDPLLGQRLAASFEMPRYRAGRPLQAVAGWLLAGGQAEAIPVGLLAVGPLAVALGCAATGRLVAAWGRSPWWGLGFWAGPRRGHRGGVRHRGTPGPGPGRGRPEPGAGAAGRRRRSRLRRGRPDQGVLPGVRGRGRGLAGPGNRRAPPGPVRRGGDDGRPRGAAAVGLWWAYVAWRIPGGPGDGEAAGAVGPPLVGWGHALG